VGLTRPRADPHCSLHVCSSIYCTVRCSSEFGMTVIGNCGTRSSTQRTAVMTYTSACLLPLTGDEGDVEGPGRAARPACTYCQTNRVLTT
jgi:hypothetical protein